MSLKLSEHLPLIASAPDGIQKLRGLILELAVRGKLVPQDPNDEPASELLMQIAKERSQKEASGIYKKSKPLPRVAEDEQPFELPNGWSWGRIADAANPQAGFAFKSAAFNDAGIGMPLIRIRDVGFSAPTTFFDGPYREEFVVSDGDYLVSMDGQFRVAVWRGPQALLNQRVSRLQFYSDSLAKSYFAISLHIRLADLQGIKAYTTVDHLSGNQIASAVVGIPPLSEQYRIVAKVDELMALCDRLESEQYDSAAAHEQLVETLLGTLTQSTDAADFEANWKRIAEHFDTLFTTEASIDALQKSILQLAVMGRLLPLDSIDEQRNWKDGVFSDFFSLEYGDNLPAPKRSGTGEYPVYGSNGVVGTHNECRVTSPCIVVGRKGSAGALNCCRELGCWVTDVAYYCVPPESVDLDFAFVLFQTLGLDTLGKGIKPGLSRSEAYLIPVAIPEITEQRLIVAKVNELIAVCEQLKASIKAATSAQSTLSAVLIQQALEAA